MALTVLTIKNARPQATAYKLSDERSLFLLVMPNGSKYWRFRYRFLGKQKTLALGVCALLTRPAQRHLRVAAERDASFTPVEPIFESPRARARRCDDQLETILVSLFIWLWTRLERTDFGIVEHGRPHAYPAGLPPSGRARRDWGPTPANS